MFSLSLGISIRLPYKELVTQKIFMTGLADINLEMSPTLEIKENSK